MTLLDDFIVRAALAGLGLVLAAAPLGCFVVWRRMAYFGDATAHAAILGVALALAFNISIFAGVLAIALIMALTVSSLHGRGFAMDTLLGVMAHSSLAFGLVAVSFVQSFPLPSKLASMPPSPLRVRSTSNHNLSSCSLR